MRLAAAIAALLAFTAYTLWVMAGNGVTGFLSLAGRELFELIRLDADRRKAVLAEQEEEGHPRNAGELRGEAGRQPALLVELEGEEKASFAREFFRLLLEAQRISLG